MQRVWSIVRDEHPLDHRRSGERLCAANVIQHNLWPGLESVNVITRATAPIQCFKEILDWRIVGSITEEDNQVFIEYCPDKFSCPTIDR